MLDIVKLLVFIFLIMPPLTLITFHSTYYIAGVKRGKRKQENYGRNNVSNDSISIIIPVKNEPKELILDAVKHLANLKDELGNKYEVIIVSDDPPKIASEIGSKVIEYSKKFGLKVRFINRIEGPPGRSAALNYGVLNSSGTIVIILDVDSRPKKGFLSSLIKCINDGYDACVGRWVGYWYKPTKLARALVASMSFIVDAIYRGRALLNLFIFPLGSGTAFRKDSLIKAGLWDPTILQDDMYIGTKFMSLGLKVGYVDEAKVSVLVPSTYEGFKTQQSRWAFGSSNVLKKALKYILKSPYSLANKIEAALYLAQYFPHAILGASLILIPLIAILTNDDVMFLNLWLSIAIFSVFSIYGYSYYHSLRSKEEFSKISRFKLVKLMGTSGALTLALSPLMLYYTVKGVITETMSYKITPKGSIEELIKTSFMFEKIFTTILIILLALLIIRGPLIFTALWLLTVIAAYIYVLTNIEKLSK